MMGWPGLRHGKPNHFLHVALGKAVNPDVTSDVEISQATSNIVRCVMTDLLDTLGSR